MTTTNDGLEDQMNERKENVKTCTKAFFAATYDSETSLLSITHDMTPRALADLAISIAHIDGVQDALSVIETELSDDDRLEAVDAEDAR